jgi:hypothetical protein
MGTRQRGTPLQDWRATLVIVQMYWTRFDPAQNKQGLLCPPGELYVSYSVSATKIIITKDQVIGGEKMQYIIL